MAKSPRVGVVLALLCLGLLGVMPILSNARPAGSADLTFAVWLTFWQLLAALPLFVLESARGRRCGGGTDGYGGGRWRTAIIALVTGAMFGLSTYMYIVAAAKAGPVSMVIALQAYPIFAILWETLFLGRRKTAAEVCLTFLMIAALVYLTTGGTFRVAGISWWSAFALGIPLLWSIAHILLKQLLDRTPITPNQVTVSRLVISGAFLLLLHAAFGEPRALSRTLVDLDLQRAAIVMGVAYYLELILWFHAIRYIDVSVASTVTVPAPAVTMLIAIVFLGEEIRGYQVVAMAVITFSMYGLLLAGRHTGPALAARRGRHRMTAS